MIGVPPIAEMSDRASAAAVRPPIVGIVDDRGEEARDSGTEVRRLDELFLSMAKKDC